jgi:hypothetical protein
MTNLASTRRNATETFSRAQAPRRLGRTLFAVILVLLAIPASAMAMTKTDAASRARSGAEHQCYDHWDHSCEFAGIILDGPKANHLGKVQWFVTVWVYTPNGLYEYQVSYDCFGNRLPGWDFQKIPISDN